MCDTESHVRVKYNSFEHCTLLGGFRNYIILERFSYDLEKWFPYVFVTCFISQWMKRTKHGLFVFPPKKTLIWRRHCSIDQSCCSMTSKQFLESSLGMKVFQPSVRLTSQKPGAFVSVRYTNQIALFPFVCCFCFVRAVKVIRKSLYHLGWEREKERDRDARGPSKFVTDCKMLARTDSEQFLRENNPV